MIITHKTEEIWYSEKDNIRGVFNLYLYIVSSYLQKKNRINMPIKLKFISTLRNHESSDCKILIVKSKISYVTAR